MVIRCSQSNLMESISSFAGAAILPVSLFLGFILFWFLLGPLIAWWIYYDYIEILPDRWTVFFWFTMFLVWSLISFFIIFFFRRCRIAFKRPETEKLPPPTENTEGYPVTFQQEFQGYKPLPTKSSIVLVPKYSSQCDISSVDKVVDNNVLLTTCWFLENEKGFYDGNEEKQCLENYSGLSPRELFFIDLIESAKRTTSQRISEPKL